MPDNEKWQPIDQAGGYTLAIAVGALVTLWVLRKSFRGIAGG